MKKLKLLPCLLLAAWLPHSLHADLAGPYTADANTLFLLHFSEATGGTATANVGSKGGTFYSVNYSSSTTTPPTVTTMLGGVSYTNTAAAVGFGSCETNTTPGYEWGYDFNNSGAYQADGGSGSADQLAMTNLNIGNGGQSPFTLEAVIQPTTTAATEEIICTDSSGVGSGGRGFQFRIVNGSLMFQFIANSAVATAAIPTTGNDAFVAGQWYHVAFAYDGTKGTLYWTLLNPTNGAAHVLTTAAMTLGTAQGAILGPLVIGNRGRPSGSETFLGNIDEVRISSVARSAGQMQFFSPQVTITANPVSQNVDYNQPVSFSVSASSTMAGGVSVPLGYLWRYNSNSIPNATNTSFSIPNVAAANAGFYDCIVTNSLGYASTSAPALLVVGAANFLADRYSFTTDTSDSIGGQTGTNFGNATVTGGKLVLDGSAGTYMQLPGGLFNKNNATALTVEWWATYGSNPNNVYTFAFGSTNFLVNRGILPNTFVSFTPHNSVGHTLACSPSDPDFAQTNTVAGNLDNNLGGTAVHIACVIDPPNQTLAIYTNGVLESINTNFTVNLSSVNDAYSYIGASLGPNDPYLTASIDEIRIFKGALSPITIKQSQDQGPNTLLADGPAKFVLQPVNASAPLGQSVTFTAATVGYLPITYQWFENGTLIPGATNASYTYIPALAENNATFNVHATNTIGVTTYVTNSATATLTVYVPPTLAWADASNGGADSSWNTSSLDWINGASIVAFAQTNGVLFDSRGAGSPSVDIGSAILPYAITVNASSDYTFYSSASTGSLIGQSGITKQNTGKLIIDVTNQLSGPVVISGGTLQVGNNDSVGSLGNAVVTNNATLLFARSDALIVGNTIHGSGNVSFDSSGTITVTGNNDYSGSTLINSGILNLQSGTGLGATSGGTTVASGAQLYITANANIGLEGLGLNGNGDGNGALRKGGAGLTVYNGPINLSSDATIGIDGGATLTLSNVVSGAAALTANGSASGTLTLSANNTFSGGFILNGPIVDLNAAHALGTGPVTVSGTGRFVIGTGLTITNPLIASTVSPGTATGLLMVNDNTNGTVTTVSGWLEFDATPSNGNDFMGPTSSGYLNITGPITNTATGMVGSRLGLVRISGGGDYSTFNVNEGTTSLGANNGLCTNATLSLGLSALARFDLNGFNQALAGLSDGATNPEFITNSAAAASTLTLNLAGGGTFSGSIGGNVALVFNGNGNTLTFSGTNDYTGNTTVNSGTLDLAQPTLAAKSTVTVANGATLQLDFSTTNIISGLVLNGVSQPLGVYNSTTSPSFISGSGSLQVAVTVATNPTNITAKVTGSTLNISWPADHTGWRLLTQTNNLNKGISTNTNDWGTVSGSDSTNQVNVTIDPTKPAEFYRITYP